MARQGRIELTVRFDNVPDHETLAAFVDRIVRAIYADDNPMNTPLHDEFVSVDISTRGI